MPRPLAAHRHRRTPEGLTDPPGSFTEQTFPAGQLPSILKDSARPEATSTRRTGRDGATRTSSEPSAGARLFAQSSAAKEVESKNVTSERSTYAGECASSRTLCSSFRRSASTERSNSPLSIRVRPRAASTRSHPDTSMSAPPARDRRQPVTVFATQRARGTRPENMDAALGCVKSCPVGDAPRKGRATRRPPRPRRITIVRRRAVPEHHSNG
jgi:hypothetical protein